MKYKIISQKMLSAECWLVQVWGKDACRDCEYHNTEDCGGNHILNSGKNTLGYAIPLPDIDKEVT